MCGGFHNADDGSVNIKFSPDVLRTYLRKLYGADFDYSTDIEPTAWREVLRIINEATIEGLAQAQQPPTPEDHFYEQLRHSNEVFSAFKVHSMSQQLGDRLLDSNGKLKPFNKWLDEVKPIASHYVGPWLRTEYNTAVARAHYAADWKTFEANSDIFPNLQWMPTTSPNPDTEHRIFWESKLTRPIDDPFWDKHHPGDRWNCKCTLEPTDEPVTDIPKPEKAKPAPGLKGNPAKTGQLFDKSHPYFPKNCKQCAFNKRKMSITNWFKNEQGDCSNCRFVHAALPKNTASGISKELKKYDPQNWKKEYVSKNGDGAVIIDRERINESKKSKNEIEKYNKELSMCKVIADNKHIVEYLREKNRNDGTFDIRIDGIPTDLKCITGGTGNMVKYAKKAIQEQMAQAVLFEIPSHDRKYYNALSEVRRKCQGKIYFYFKDERIIKEVI